MTLKILSFRWYMLVPVLAAVLLGACREEEEPIIEEEEEIQELSRNASINEWIQEVMDEVYLWLDDMRTPVSAEREPEEYFESLLFRPTDRFSDIFESATELTDGLGGTSTEAGYEFGLFTTPTPGQVIAEVTYIKRGSPAENKDILRGDVITAINGQNMTVDNYRTLLREIRNAHSISYRRFNEATGSFEIKPDLQMEVARVSENPNFMDSVYTIGSQKIGYVVYHFFAPSPTPQTAGSAPIYDDEMDQIFQKFKTEGVNHLIVDFRYNGGGYVSSAVNLASLIAPGISSSEVFSKTRYNSFLMSFDIFRNVQTRFRDKAENIGAQLGGKVYILTSGRTASASELIINSLRPYMDVVIIGDRTFGKNVGSIVIQDEDDPDNNYGLLPIVSQSFNSNDQSDYGNGFAPNVEALENTERLRQFGDVNEILLRTAIGQITGTPPAARYEILDRKDLGNTIDLKIRSGVMIEDIKLDR